MLRIFPASVAYRWGSTPEEREASYPCTGLIERPNDELFRAVDIEAPPAIVFRWLCQLRAAPYSYDWIDNLGRRSPRRLIPGLEQLEVGQTFMTIFELVSFVPDGQITLRMVTEGARCIFGEVAGTYRVAAIGAGRTRLVAKLIVRRPRNLRWRWVGPLLPWGDLVMMRKQLLTIRKLSEQTRQRTQSDDG